MTAALPALAIAATIGSTVLGVEGSLREGAAAEQAAQYQAQIALRNQQTAHQNAMLSLENARFSQETSRFAVESARLAEEAARISEVEAVRSVQRSQIEQEEQDMTALAFLGAQEALQGASGLSLGGSSQMMARKAARELGRLDSLRVREGGELEASQHRMEAFSRRLEGRSRLMEAKGALVESRGHTIQAQGARAQALNFGTEAQLIRAEGRNARLASFFNAGQSLLTGARRVAGSDFFKRRSSSRSFGSLVS